MWTGSHRVGAVTLGLRLGLAVALGSLASASGGSTTPESPARPAAARYHKPQKSAPPHARSAPKPADADWNPLASPMTRLDELLHRYGIVQDLDEAPFGRKRDMLGVGAAWIDPSPDAGFRDSIRTELFYRVQLSPSIGLTPTLQVIVDPPNDPTTDVIWLPGLRLALSL